MRDIKYTNDEIVLIAEKLYEDYMMAISDKSNYIKTVQKIANLLEDYEIDNDDRLVALECASRIKYEMFIATTYNSNVNRFYYRFKKYDFIIKMALFYIESSENENNYEIMDDLPNEIRLGLNNAYFKIRKDYKKKVMTKKYNS